MGAIGHDKIACVGGMGELKGRGPFKAYTRLPQTSIVGRRSNSLRGYAPAATARTAPQQSSWGNIKANGTPPRSRFYTLVLFSTPNVQLTRPKSGGRPDDVGLALLLKADDLGSAAIKMIERTNSHRTAMFRIRTKVTIAPIT